MPPKGGELRVPVHCNELLGGPACLANLLFFTDPVSYLSRQYEQELRQCEGKLERLLSVPLHWRRCLQVCVSLLVRVQAYFVGPLGHALSNEMLLCSTIDTRMKRAFGYLMGL